MNFTEDLRKELVSTHNRAEDWKRSSEAKETIISFLTSIIDGEEHRTEPTCTDSVDCGTRIFRNGDKAEGDDNTVYTAEYYPGSDVDRIVAALRQAVAKPDDVQA